MRAAALLASLLIVAPAASGSDAPGHTGALGPYPMTREASGTSWQPDAADMEGRHLLAGSWRLMLHSNVSGVFTRQGGPRGGEQVFSTSMVMAAATRHLGRGLLLGLEILVAADIIRTVALEPTLASIAALGLLVLIRTFLGWSLTVEIEGRWPWQGGERADRSPDGGE